jgi:hypothetical protein
MLKQSADFLVGEIKQIAAIKTIAMIGLKNKILISLILLII